MKVWVTRDDNYQGKCAGFRSKPHIPDGETHWNGENSEDVIFDLFVDRFKHLAGFTPRKGSCKQYELSLKEVK